MPLESFFTVQNNLPPATSQKPVSPIVSEQGPDDGQIDGQNFLDFILAQLGEETPENEKQVVEIVSKLAPEQDASDIAAEIQTLVEEKGIDPSDLLNINTNVLTEITQLDSELSLEETLALNEVAIKDLLASVQVEDGLIIESEEIPQELAALLNLNLTPAQISALSSDETAQDIPDDIFSALVALVPAQQQNIDPGTLSASQEMAARLNSLNVGSEGGDEMAQLLKYLENFKASGKVEAGLQTGAQQNSSSTTNAAGSPVIEQAVSQAGGFESTLKGWPFSMDGSLLASFDSRFAESLSAQSPLSANATQMGTLTSLIGQSQSAGHTHPATQMVAVNIQKAAGKGESTNLTLQLDPPELGRVEVRLNFGKDKVLKAVVTAEKPETYLMLQRDAQALERAIQDIGLDSDGGIAFELAEQGFDFGQDNQRGGGHDQGGTGAGGEDSEELIESTMTWHVDPESGHMRYDILV